MKTTKATEDYLEAIYILEQKKLPIKSIRIAEMLGFSRPAINQAMNELIALGHIEKPDYSEISLTKSGREIAIKTYERHKLITTFLSLIGVDSDIAEIDSCKIEHVVSEQTINAMANFLNKNK